MPPAIGARSQGSSVAIVVLALMVAGLAGGLWFVYSAKSDLMMELDKAKSETARQKERANALESTLRDAVPWFVAAGEGGLAGDELSGPARGVAEAIKQELVTNVSEKMPDGTSLHKEDAEMFLRSQNTGYSILDVVRGYKARIASLEAELQTQKQRVTQEKEKAESARSQALSDIDALEKRITRLTADARDARDLESRAEQEKEKAVAEIKVRLEFERDGRVNDKSDHEREQARKTQTIQKLETDIASLKRGGEIGASRLIEEDGRVIDVDQAADIVVVDIGGRERVRPGMRFDAYWREKGGKPIWKGMIEIIEVDPKVSISRARIVRERQFAKEGDQIVDRRYDPDDPITPGCMVDNPYFQRGRQVSFALVGEFQYHTVDELKKLIAADGESTVVDDVNRATFVVLGKPPLGIDPVYTLKIEDIRLNRLEVMREEEFMRYLRNFKQDDEIATIRSSKR